MKLKDHVKFNQSCRRTICLWANYRQCTDILSVCKITPLLKRWAEKVKPLPTNDIPQFIPIVKMKLLVRL